MAVSIMKPDRPVDPLDRIANAVGIARSVYGMTVDSRNLDEQRKEREANAQLRQDQSKKTSLETKLLEQQLAGEMTPLQVATSGGTLADSPSPGAIPVTVSGIGQKYFKPKSGESASAEALRGLEIQGKQLDNQKKKQDLIEGKTPTGDQSKAATFAKRLEQAEGVFTDLSSSGDTGTDTKTAVQRSSLMPEFAKSENMKKRQQAERNFVNALLRRESGAAISQSEFTSAESQYFPRMGDTEDVLAQKAQNRALAMDGLRAEAGNRALGNIDKQAAAMPMPAPRKEKSALSDEDRQAIAWAQANPKDPRSQQILKMHGANTKTAGR